MAKFQPFNGAHPGDPLYGAEFGICGVLHDFLDARRALADQEPSVRAYLLDHPDKEERMREHLASLRANEQAALESLCLAAALHSCCPEKSMEQVKEVLGVQTTAVILDD